MDEQFPFVARATHDFKDDEPGELNLSKGDIIQVIGRVDKHWFQGYSNGVEGNFPSSFVTEIEWPKTLMDFNTIFASTSAFTEQETGDLGFDVSQVIVGTESLNDDWFRGFRLEDFNRRETCNGIFPLTHVWQLNPQYLPKNETERVQWAVVKNDLKPALEEELSLLKGDRIKIFGNADKFNYKAEFNGRVGIVPKGFVEIIELEEPVDEVYNSDHLAIPGPSTSTIFQSVEEPAPSDSPPKYEDIVKLDANNRPIIEGVQAYAQVLYNFDSEYDGELSLRKGAYVNLIRHVDDQWCEGELDGQVGIFPRNYVDIIIDCDQAGSEYPYVYPEGTFGRVMYDFIGTAETDLTCYKDERLKIIQQMNTDWLEASNMSEKVGFVPINFIEFIQESCVNGDVEVVQPQQPEVRVISPEPESSSRASIQEEPAEEPPARIATLTAHETSADVVDAMIIPQIPRNASPVKRRTPLRPAPPRPVSSASSSSGAVSLPQEAPLSEPERRHNAQRSKALEQRSCILMEMLQSERDYCNGLKVCEKIFTKDEKIQLALRDKNVDLELIFGDLRGIIGVSEQLIEAIEGASRASHPEGQLIGQCFLALGGKLKNSYQIYCKNHEDSVAAWRKIHEDRMLKPALDRGVEKVKSEINCVDIPGLLIKPVQRILKYPLLLHELVKYTDDSLPDKRDLLEAFDLMTEIAHSLNEFKRSKELINKYRRDKSNESFSSKFSKLNMHSVLKKSSRLSYRISTTLGLSEATKDENFEREAAKIKMIHDTVRNFHDDCKAFIVSMEKFVISTGELIEAIALYYGDGSRDKEIERLRKWFKILNDDLAGTMIKGINDNILKVLSVLLEKFENPLRLKAKRDDKLVDYDRKTKQVESCKDQTRQRALKEEQLLAKNTYEALNQQLLEELPRFCSIAVDVFVNSVMAFMKLKRAFLFGAGNEMLSMMKLPLLCGWMEITSPQEVLETFSVKYNLIFDQLLSDFQVIPVTIFPNSTQTSLADRKRREASGTDTGPVLPKLAMSGSIQNETHRVYIKNHYGDSIYRAREDYVAADMHEISVRSGDLIGVIKFKEPTGSDRRWFVDSGLAKGFLPSSILFIERGSRESIATGGGGRNQVMRSESMKYRAPAPPLPSRSSSIDQRNFGILDSTGIYANLDSLDVNDTGSSGGSTGRRTPARRELDEFDPLAGSDRYENIVDDKYENIDDNEESECSDRDEPPCNETYFAAFRFNSQGEHQLSIATGTKVLVLFKCDMKGNTEWWYVKDDKGKKGYVPASFLKTYR